MAVDGWWWMVVDGGGWWWYDNGVRWRMVVNDGRMMVDGRGWRWMTGDGGGRWWTVVDVAEAPVPERSWRNDRLASLTAPAAVAAAPSLGASPTASAA